MYILYRLRFNFILFEVKSSYKSCTTPKLCGKCICIENSNQRFYTKNIHDINLPLYCNANAVNVDN
jgi:hypothetical protein